MNLVSPQLLFNKEQAQFECKGDWSVLNVGGFLNQFKSEELPSSKHLVIQAQAVGQFDSAGALVFLNCIEALKAKDNQITLEGFSKNQLELLKLVESKSDYLSYQIPEPKKEGMLYHIGKESINKLLQLDGLIILIGDLSARVFEAFGDFRRFQWPSIVSIVGSAGLRCSLKTSL